MIYSTKSIVFLNVNIIDPLSRQIYRLFLRHCTLLCIMHAHIFKIYFEMWVFVLDKMRISIALMYLPLFCTDM